MKRSYAFIPVVSIFLLFVAAVSIAVEVSPAPNGLTLPDGYKNWRLISSSHRTDNNTLRVILE